MPRSPSPAAGGRGRSKSPSAAQLRKSFQSYDFNGDGEISFDELMNAVKRLPGCQANEASVRAMMAAADMDSNGMLSESEFMKVMADTDAGLGAAHGNWAVMSLAAAELTIAQTKATISSSLDKAERLGRAPSRAIQTQLSAGEEGGTVGSIPRLAAMALDVLYMGLIGGAVLGVEYAVIAVDFNTFWAAAEAFTGNDFKEGVASKWEIILAPLEDIVDGAGAVTTVSFLLLVVGALFYSILYRSQTIGQLVLNHVVIDTALTKGQNKNARRVSPMSAVMFNLLSVPALDALTGLAGKAVGAKVVFSWSITETKLRTPPAPKSSAKWSKGGSLASLVHVPWGARPWSNAGFIALYVVFTAGCIQSTDSYLSRQGVNDSEALAKQLLQWSQWFSLFGSIPLVCAANPGLMTAALAITYGVSAVLLLIVREFLRPILYLLMLAFALGTVGSTLASGLQGVPIFMLIGPVIGAVTALRYLYQYRASFELQIAIYKEAIVASLVNPLLTFLVPVIEAAFQLYQFQLLAKVVLVHWTTPTNHDDQQHKQHLLSALWFHQYWTVFTLRVVFEMVCASVIGKYYFRKAGASSANGLTRTLDAIASVLTKSLGTACFFGLVQFVVMALQRLHNIVSQRFHKTSWAVLPVKLVLFVVQFLLAVLISYVESLSGLSITYAGITGEGLCDSARRATDTMTTDGVQVLSVSVFFGLACVRLPLTRISLSIILMTTACVCVCVCVCACVCIFVCVRAPVCFFAVWYFTGVGRHDEVEFDPGRPEHHTL